MTVETFFDFFCVFDLEVIKHFCNLATDRLVCRSFYFVAKLYRGYCYRLNKNKQQNSLVFDLPLTKWAFCRIFNNM